MDQKFVISVICILYKERVKPDGSKGRMKLSSYKSLHCLRS